jgi:hypothetical protein
MAGTALGHRALPASPLMMRRRWGEPRQGVGIVRGSASGHEDQFPSPMSSDRCRFSQETFARSSDIGRSAPTADVCDKGVFWKSSLRPRTMLSLKKAGILSCATRPG